MEEIKESRGEILEDKTGEVKSEDVLLQIRKEKILGFLKKNYNYLVYAALAIIVFLAVRIRTRNIPGLKDVTTGGWTLGPDLDPFLFLRWAKYIVANGSLFSVDMMRYVPLGFNIEGELILHPYLMAWLHNLLSFFGWTDSVTYSAIIYPVFMFALTVIAFFFLVRKIFLEKLGSKRAAIIGLISSFFLTVIPTLLPRTIAGIPEKESAGFLFMFLSFYFFICAWKSKKNISAGGFALLAGISTASMALIWGGFTFIFLTIGPAVFVAFLIGKVEKKEFLIYGAWLFSSFIMMHPFSTRYSISDLVTSIDTGSAFAVLVVIRARLII